MSESLLASIEACFSDVQDPRVQGRCDHQLLDILVIAICGVLCGADSWVAIETFSLAKQAWLQQFLALPNGIPAHDTFGYVFARLDAQAFQTSFARWVQRVFQVTDEQVVAIDGKTLRRRHDKHLGKEAIHMVSAWASANRIVLGQYKVDDKSNEITAIPALLKLLYVRGCLVTIDAMGCQKKIAQAVRDAHADYLLRVKDNQGQLHQDIVDWFAHADQVQFAGMQHTYCETVNKQHGRVEIRRCWAFSDEYLRHYDGWADLALLVRVERERRWQGNSTHEVAYYISSRVQAATAVLEATRHHWGVENSLHWVLDVTFKEDAAPVRVGHSPHNFAVLRHIALNILKQDQSKRSLMQKRFKAALDTDFLLRLLHQF